MTIPQDIIIGIGHRSGVGKTTAARMLYDEFEALYPGSVALCPIAAGVKAAARCLYGGFGLLGEEYYESHRDARTQPLKTIGQTPTELWVNVGRVGRMLDPDLWINHAITAAAGTGIIIIPDVRTLREVRAIKARDGIILHICRDVPDVPGATMDNELDDVDYADRDILNTGSLELLRALIHSAAVWIQIEKDLYE